MKVFSIYSIKGGVGKTAAAVNLSYFCAKDNLKALIWDLDPQGATSYYFNTKAKVKGGTKKLLKAKDLEEYIKDSSFENLDILPADFSYRNMDLLLDNEKKSEKKLAKQLENLKNEYEVIFLDSPPNISLLSENIFNASDYILTPVIPTPLSLRTHQQILSYFKDKNINSKKILPFFSMVDRRKNLHKEIIAGKDISNSLDNIIPYSSTIEKMGIFCSPVNEFSPNSLASRAYLDLWEEIKIVCKIGHSAHLNKIFGKAK